MTAGSKVARIADRSSERGGDERADRLHRHEPPANLIVPCNGQDPSLEHLQLALNVRRYGHASRAHAQLSSVALMEWMPPPDGIAMCQGGDVCRTPPNGEGIHEKASIIGLDLAKRSFQAHGALADGSVAFRKKLTREKVLGFFAERPRCIVAMEACGSAHHWGRAIRDAGHEVRLIPPAYVKPFVKRQKNDAADAEAIAEAASRPTMRFVAVKTAEQQARAMLFRTRDLLVRQRTQLINALRGQLSEQGVVAPQGPANVAILAQAIEDMTPSLPLLVVELARVYLDQIDGFRRRSRGSRRR